MVDYDMNHVPDSNYRAALASSFTGDNLKIIEEKNVNFFRLQFVDIFGFMKNVAIPRSQIGKALDGQMMFDGSSIEPPGARVLFDPAIAGGVVTLHGRRHEVSGYDMRDRSWQLRADDRSTRGAYSYGIAGARDAFLAFAFPMGEEERVVAGFLLRDGEKADLVAGTRRVLRSAGGWPAEVVIEARDARGRELLASGTTQSRLAHQASPGLFAWMSFTRWDFAGGCYGQDQDIWSPDLLTPRPAAR